MISEDLRGILYMVAGCTGFIFNDTLVKLASEDIPIPQVIVLRSLIALPVVVFFCWQQGVLGNLLALGDRFLWLRTLGELGGTAPYLTALARLEIANTTAIAQLTPLAVTAGAALFLGEKVGIRRWTAIAIGFLAVLLIIRPGMEGFNAWSLLVARLGQLRRAARPQLARNGLLDPSAHRHRDRARRPHSARPRHVARRAMAADDARRRSPIASARA